MSDQAEHPLVPVDGVALRAILVALHGEPHLIRELQATRSLPDNPITTVTDQFNRFVRNQPEKPRENSVSDS